MLLVEDFVEILVELISGRFWRYKNAWGSFQCTDIFESLQDILSGGKKKTEQGMENVYTMPPFVCKKGKMKIQNILEGMCVYL